MNYDILMYLITGAFIVEVLDNLVLRYKIRKVEEDIWMLKCTCRDIKENQRDLYREIGSKLGGNENEK